MKKNTILILLILVLAAVLAALAAFALLWNPEPEKPTEPTESSAASTPDTTETEVTTLPIEPPVVKESSATVSAMGDMLMHIPVINTGYQSDTGTYDFYTVFRYFTDYLNADMAVANLETTLAGVDNGYAYSGYPQFNCPDGIVESLKNAGFDLLLTANNHTYDTRTVGLNRTLQVIREQALMYLGTKADAQEPDYVIAELNGIRIGMLCYTYETTDGTGDQIALNGNYLTAEDSLLVNAFSYEDLPGFYEDLEENLGEMEALGAEATILFIHWGEEYHTQENSTQNEIAQSLCDLGIDVIIGGHPHVVQPVELLTSADESHKTVCLYSLGNAVSNQRKQYMDLDTGHTEDGVLFSVRFSKYSDGTVILSDVELLPTWVNMHYNSQGQKEYNILPLDTQIEDWKTQFGLTEDTLTQAQASYERTMAIVGNGMAEVDAWLEDHVAQTEFLLGVENET